MNNLPTKDVKMIVQKNVVKSVKRSLPGKKGLKLDSEHLKDLHWIKVFYARDRKHVWSNIHIH